MQRKPQQRLTGSGSTFAYSLELDRWSDSPEGKVGGWYPRDCSKGKKPVAEEVSELCAYPTHTSWEDQEEGFGGGLHSRELFLVLGLASLIDQHVENENLSWTPRLWVLNIRSFMPGRWTEFLGCWLFLRELHAAWKHHQSIISFKTVQVTVQNYF